MFAVVGLIVIFVILPMMLSGGRSRGTSFGRRRTNFSGRGTKSWSRRASRRAAARVIRGR